MSRQPVFFAVAFLCLFLTQVWLVYRVETVIARSEINPITTANSSEAFPVTLSKLNADTDAAVTAQMNARISALENRDMAAGKPVSSDQIAPIAFDGPEALAADRKLQTLLPKEPLSHEDLIHFQAQLGQLPEAERHQLLAALSRAINNGRVQQKFN